MPSRRKNREKRRPPIVAYKAGASNKIFGKKSRKITPIFDICVIGYVIFVIPKNGNNKRIGVYDKTGYNKNSGDKPEFIFCYIAWAIHPINKIPKKLNMNDNGMNREVLIFEQPKRQIPNSSGRGEAITKPPARAVSHRKDLNLNNALILFHPF